MDWLLGLLPGGGITAILGLVSAALVALGTLLWKTKQAGRNEQKVDEYERHLEDLERIKRASRAKPVDSVSDPHNRDNWSKP